MYYNCNEFSGLASTSGHGFIFYIIMNAIFKWNEKEKNGEKFVNINSKQWVSGKHVSFDRQFNAVSMFNKLGTSWKVSYWNRFEYHN